MDYKIPRMLLQPIIENAIVHGYKNFKNKCRIDIIGRIVGNHPEITIRDYGEGLPVSAFEKLQSKLVAEDSFPSGIQHIALLNIDCRIKSYYGKISGLNISSTPDKGTTIVVRLGDSLAV